MLLIYYNRVDTYELYIKQTQSKVDAKQKCLLDILVWFV